MLYKHDDYEIKLKDGWNNESSPDEIVQTSKVFEIVRQAISGLSPQKQEIIYLRYNEQMKTKDIAEYVGLSYGNVRRILCETLAQLSKVLMAYKL